MERMQTAAEAIEEIISRPPAFHGPGNMWGLGASTMRWLARTVQPGWQTIETGCGNSSALFAVVGATHTIVAPERHEHEAVRSWCAERGFSTDRVTSVVALSQEALPSLAQGEFDLALIDGGHAFPTPIIDWYYLAGRLRSGGYLVIDDIAIRAPRLLRDFLASDTDRWEREATLQGAVVFRKLGDAVIPADDWVSQPWSNTLVSRARVLVRLRTRLRRLARRSQLVTAAKGWDRAWR